MYSLKLSCSEKLIQVLNLVKNDLMKLPSIRYSVIPTMLSFLPLILSSDYSDSVKGKFSFIRSVLCCHLLTSSEKLNKLYHAYDTLGVSITSRVGQSSSLLISCE